MAGRGTDIKLGGDEIKELGGLHILGTERHESRRIDLQLRGRSGRQGDPGSSIFYLSLEDNLMRLFNSERVASIMDRMGVEEGEVITAKMVTRAIANAQKKVEGRNFGIRKHLLEYDDVMNQQRQVIYNLRDRALNGDNTREMVSEFICEFVDDEFEGHDSTHIEDMDMDNLKQNIASHLLVDLDLNQIQSGQEGEDIDLENIREYIISRGEEVYRERESILPEEIMRGFERFVILRTIDEQWKDHLYGMDQIREGINLRAYGQKDPLLEYKSEGFHLFQSMIKEMNQKTVQRLFRTQLQGMENAPQIQRKDRNIRVRHDSTEGMGIQSAPQGGAGQRPPQPVKAPVVADKKIGRNEKIPVISPSGEKVFVKYKKLNQLLSKGYSRVS